MEYYSAIKRNKFESVLVRWMNPEPVTEWNKSKREKQISCINTYIWNLEKWSWWTYLQGQEWRCRHRDILVDIAGGGEGGTNGENSIEAYTRPYGSLACCSPWGQKESDTTELTGVKIHSQWEFSVWCRELNPGLCDNLEGWDGVGGGREF